MKKNQIRWIHIISAVVLLVTFFLPWVSWEGNQVKGMDIATGSFFKITESKFELKNPFPQLSFLFYAFWLIPIFCIASIAAVWTDKKLIPVSCIAGAMSLGLLTIFILFSRILIDLGAGTSVTAMLKPAAYTHAVAALLLIITSFAVKPIGWKVLWLVLGPVVAYGSFKIGEKKVLGEKFKESRDIKADFVVPADKLISEFLANDTAANRKYREKMLEVNGVVNAVDVLEDSTSTIKFADSTGSYAIFSFEKDQLKEVKTIQAGTMATIKGVCSGSIFSEILGTTSISFKRSTINKK